jgi:hypothetical protein
VVENDVEEIVQVVNFE